MPDGIKADFIDMHLAAKQLGDWHVETSEVFDRAHQTLESATNGWVGSSATALADAAAKIRASQHAVTSRLADHSSGISSAARALQQQDSSTGTALRRSAPAGPALNLDV